MFFVAGNYKNLKLNLPVKKFMNNNKDRTAFLERTDFAIHIPSYFSLCILIHFLITLFIID